MQTTSFTLVEERALTEVGGTARLWKHTVTGAQVLSVVNDDENKCFGVSFRTPPKDSSGVAHILEHSVLCGSDKYPLKEPFVNLLKGSLQTFLNAFTYPDKTCYPVASANLQDFYNLIDVYIDAVLHPCITENTFRQEGWHIEAPTQDGPWEYRGVVYNEMKGVYSSPESRLAEEYQHALFPDTLYALDSGGRPDAIPSLTYAAFREFHASYYHPSNARFFFWGDDPEEERLAIIERALAGYTARSVDSAIPMQPAYAAPRRIVKPYPVSEEEQDAKALFTMNWLVGDRCDNERCMVLSMLCHIIEGMSGSPLRRTLVSSGLGEDLTGGGLETELRQMCYSIGLQGIAEKDVPAAEELILSTLKKLADEGIDDSAIEAAVNSLEFSLRENNMGSFPRGLSAMLQALAVWLYDANPLDALAWEAPLARIKARLASGEKLFENEIRASFLDNPSRVTVILVPDAEMGPREEADEKARVEAIRAAATDEEKARCCEITRILKEAQEASDSPEALATIPNLMPADLPAKNRTTPIAVASQDGMTRISHALATRGIAYTDLLLPAPAVPDSLISRLPLFTRTLREAGTARRDYTELGALIAARTGGIGTGMLTLQTVAGKTKLYTSVSGKAVYDKLPQLVEIEQEILSEPCTDHAVLGQRVREMLLADKAQLEQGAMTSGHATARMRIEARLNPVAALSERRSGIEYLKEVRSLLKDWETKQEGVLADIESLRALLLHSSDAIADCIAEQGHEQAALDGSQALAGVLPAGAACTGEQQIRLLDACPAEVFVTPSKVNYVAKGCNLFDLGYKYRGCDSVIMRYLRMGYLWDRVRVRGGAYGAGCSLNRMSGFFACSSYRDPNVESTLDAYDGIAEYLRTCSIDKDELGRAIVGAVGDLDLYMLPDARGARSLSQYLIGDTEEARQQMREEMFATTIDDFRALADVMDAAAKAGIICIVGGSAAGDVAQHRGWKCENLFQ